MHPHELIRREQIIVHLDYMNSGVGSNSPGPMLQSQYRLSYTNIDFKVRLKLVFKEEAALLDLIHIQFVD